MLPMPTVLSKKANVNCSATSFLQSDFTTLLIPCFICGRFDVTNRGIYGQLDITRAPAQSGWLPGVPRIDRVIFAGRMTHP